MMHKIPADKIASIMRISIMVRGAKTWKKGFWQIAVCRHSTMRLVCDYNNKFSFDCNSPKPTSYLFARSPFTAHDAWCIDWWAGCHCSITMRSERCANNFYSCLMAFFIGGATQQSTTHNINWTEMANKQTHFIIANRPRIVVVK